MDGAETWTLRKIEEKYLENFEMWRWSRKEISWLDRVKNEAVLKRLKEKRNILQTIKRRTGSWIRHILRINCFLNHVIERMVEVMRRWKRCKQLQDVVKKRRIHLNFKEEALDRTFWVIRFRRGRGPVTRQTLQWTNEKRNTVMEATLISKVWFGWATIPSLLGADVMLKVLWRLTNCHNLLHHYSNKKGGTTFGRNVGRLEHFDMDLHPEYSTV